jgi:imidazolonepropionase-like amidohydrolase
MTIGPLRAGEVADVIGLRADPFDDPEAFGRVGLVVRRGTVRRND